MRSSKDIHLSIDKENVASIHLALHCGFIENKDLEQELQEYNDNRTRIFTIHNHVDTIQESQKSFVKRIAYHSNTKKTVSNDIKSI